MPLFSLSQDFIMGAVIAGGLPLAIGVGRYLVGNLTSTPAGRAHGQIMADLLAAAEPLVLEAEKLNIPGADKADLVEKQLRAMLAERGLSGDAQRVYHQYIPHLIEVAVSRSVPKLPAAAASLVQGLASVVTQEPPPALPPAK